MDFNKDELVKRIDDDSFITEVAEKFYSLNKSEKIKLN